MKTNCTDSVNFEFSDRFIFIIEIYAIKREVCELEVLVLEVITLFLFYLIFLAISEYTDITS